MTERLTSTEVRAWCADILDKVARGARVVVTRRDKDIVAIVPIADLEWLKRLDSESTNTG